MLQLTAMHQPHAPPRPPAAAAAAGQAAPQPAASAAAAVPAAAPAAAAAAVIKQKRQMRRTCTLLVSTARRSQCMVGGTGLNSKVREQIGDSVKFDANLPRTHQTNKTAIAAVAAFIQSKPELMELAGGDPAMAVKSGEQILEAKKRHRTAGRGHLSFLRLQMHAFTIVR